MERLVVDSFGIVVLIFWLVVFAVFGFAFIMGWLDD